MALIYTLKYPRGTSILKTRALLKHPLEEYKGELNRASLKGIELKSERIPRSLLRGTLK